MFMLKSSLAWRTFMVFFLILLGLSEDADARSSWKPYLKELNQEAPASSSRYLHAIDSDLLQTYKNEIRDLDALWSKEIPPKSADANRLKNEFYHKRLEEMNDQSFQLLSKGAPVDRKALAEKVLREVHKNPIANLEATQAYDPSGQLGFCFGRALLVHYLLLKAGVKQEDISKVFLAGQLRVAGRMWNFHVAVVVRSGPQKYLVVDPLFEKPMTLEDWRAKTSAFDIKGKYSRARYYVTDARKFLPEAGIYSEKVLESEHLKKYFDDLRRTLP